MAQLRDLIVTGAARFVNGAYFGGASTFGSATRPVWWNNGFPQATTYSLSATLNAGSANRLAYYSGANAVSASSHYASATQVGINITNVDTIGSRALYVNGTSEFSDDIYANKSIRNLAIGGGLYWNPYVESTTDSSDAASITLIKAGVAGGTELQIKQANDQNDVINLVAPYYIYLNSKRAFTVNDSWLRINDTSTFTSGIYTGTSILRTDNQLQVGNNGANFYVKNTGDAFIQKTLGIAGVNIGYALYVNGKANIDDETAATSASTGALTVSGGIGVRGNSYFGGNVTATLFLGDAAGHKLGYRHLDAGNPNSWSDSKLYIGYGALYPTRTIGFYNTNSDNTGNTLWAEINDNGFYAKTRFGVNGQNTSYNFYVNGTSYFANYLQTTSYFKSTVATGTAPIQVTSTTLNANLNTDLLDGWHKQDILGTYYATSGTADLSHYWCKIWSITNTSRQYDDIGITIYVQSQYDSKYGLFTWRIRQNGANNSGAYSFSVGLQEHFGNIASTDIRLYYDNATGVCEVWVNCWARWGVWNYSVLKKCWRTNADSMQIGTFYNNSFTTTQTLPTSSYITASYTPFLGNASTATALTSSAGNTGQPVYFSGGKPVAIDWHIGNSGVGEHDCNNVTYNFCGYYTSNGPATSLGASTTDGALYAQAYNSTWVGQIAQDYRNGGLYVRGKNNGTWQAWYQVLDTRNYTGVLDGRYVNASGDTMTGQLNVYTTLYDVSPGNAAIQIREVGCSGTSSTHDVAHSPRLGFHWGNRYWGQIAFFNGEFQFRASDVNSYTVARASAFWGAVWNDYAECRQTETEEPGYVFYETGQDDLKKTIERLQHFAGVSSDTWGFSQGETKKAKTPIAVAGRVLVYPYRDRNEYKPGDCVCAAPGGTVDIMTREEIIKYPDRIVGTVSCVPEYETWGGNESADRDPVKVNGRIWIKVK